MRAVILAVALVAGAMPAAAQSINSATAERQLFPTRGIQIAVSRALSDQDRAIVSAMAEEARRTRQPFHYYGSIAWSPSEGLQSDALQGAFNFHSTQAADAAAVAACNAARPSGARPCEVAAQILPRRYEPGRMQLSFDATNAFRLTFRRVRGDKAFAISQETGAWQMARGDDPRGAAQTAVALCNQSARSMGGSADCTPVVVD